MTDTVNGTTLIAIQVPCFMNTMGSIFCFMHIMHLYYMIIHDISQPIMFTRKTNTHTYILVSEVHCMSTDIYRMVEHSSKILQLQILNICIVHLKPLKSIIYFEG